MQVNPESEPLGLQHEALALLPARYHHLLENAKVTAIRETKEVTAEHRRVFEQRIRGQASTGGIDEASIEKKLSEFQPPYEKDSKVIEMVSGRELRLGQVHDDVKKVGVGYSRWFSPYFAGDQHRPSEVQYERALPRMPTHHSEATIASGTRMRLGWIAPYEP